MLESVHAAFPEECITALRRETKERPHSWQAQMSAGTVTQHVVVNQPRTVGGRWFEAKDFYELASVPSFSSSSFKNSSALMSSVLP